MCSGNKRSESQSSLGFARVYWGSPGLARVRCFFRLEFACCSLDFFWEERWCCIPGLFSIGKTYKNKHGTWVVVFFFFLFGFLLYKIITAFEHKAPFPFLGWWCPHVFFRKNVTMSTRLPPPGGLPCLSCEVVFSSFKR